MGSVNQSLALEVVEALRRAGVRTFCLCPGGRNAPLVEALEPLRQDEVEVLDFFDERAAAFFALGRARRDGRPAAVVTTSGTAAAELLPAMVEAYYQGAPLLAVTADRPQSFRGTGAPQSIEQAGLFGVYARQAVDLDGPGTRWRIDPCCWPVHLNVAFDEPLLEGWGSDTTARPPSGPIELPAAEAVSDVGPVLAVAASIRRPLVILGAIGTVEDREAAARFCAGVRAPVLAEAASQLHDRVGDLLLKGGEAVAAAGLRRGWFDGVVRVGDVPSFRLWRDLERRPELAVLSVSRLPWRGLTHGVHVHVPRGAPLPLDGLAGSDRDRQRVRGSAGRRRACRLRRGEAAEAVPAVRARHGPPALGEHSRRVVRVPRKQPAHPRVEPVRRGPRLRVSGPTAAPTGSTASCRPSSAGPARSRRTGRSWATSPRCTICRRSGRSHTPRARCASS